MTANELGVFDSFMIVKVAERDAAFMADVDRRYPEHVNKPWMICSGSTLECIVVVREGVHMTILPETEVKRN